MPRPLAADAALGGALLAVAGILALHALEPALDPRCRYMSEYAFTPHGWVLHGVLAATSAASVALAFALGRALPNSRWVRVAGALLAVWAAAILALAAFPEGARHDAALHVARAGFVGGVLATILAVRGRARWRGFASASFALGGLAVAGFVGVGLVAGWPGIGQRIAGVAAIGWILLAAERARRATRGNLERAP